MNLSKLSKNELLELRFSDLKLSLKESEFNARAQQLYRELELKGLRFRPHFWIGQEWFAAEGVPGVSVPFYLMHPRLKKLEQNMMFEVEGGTKSECMRILRHETGHAIDFAYRLHRKKNWREQFGNYSTPYPETYRPKPQSKDYVLHLADWYAQAHPAEDFAETFAVWLTPHSRWRSRYKDWPALRKLKFVDELMQEIATQQQPVRSRRQVEPISKINETLGEFYERKREYYAFDMPDFTDRHLLRIFSSDDSYLEHISAAKFIRENRKDFRETVSFWTNTSTYTLDQVLNRVADRSKELKLRLTKSERETKRHFLVLLTMLTMNYIYSGHVRIAL